MFKHCFFFFAPVNSISYLPTPPLGQDMTEGQFFKRSLAGLNSEFSFCETSCLTKAEEPSLPYYLSIAGGNNFSFNNLTNSRLDYHRILR